MSSRSEQERLCPICRDICKDPVSLQCSHSLCKVCLQGFWEGKWMKLCPVCKEEHFQSDPPQNQVLKKMFEEISLGREREAAAGPKDLCSLHSEKLKLFCLDHQEPVCVICKDSKVHNNHRFTPIDEAVQVHREELQKALKPVEEKLKLFKDVKGNCDRTAEHIKIQVKDAERQIRGRFQKLHQFLQEEEAARIAALRKEEEQKSLVMERKIEYLSEVITVLSDTVRVTREEMRDEDISLLLNYKARMSRVRRPLLDDPHLVSGALIDMAKHLGNLAFNVWSKMREMVSYTPVILDPNSAHPSLILSDDLTSVRRGHKLQRPDNPERFDHLGVVLGSEGFHAENHTWDVEVGDAEAWDIGVVGASAQRKGQTLSECWGVKLLDGEYMAASPALPDKALSLKTAPQRIRVTLEGNRRVSFYDAGSNRRIHTFTHTVTERLFPYLKTRDESVKIVPLKVSVTQEKHSLPLRPLFSF